MVELSGLRVGVSAVQTCEAWYHTKNNYKVGKSQNSLAEHIDLKEGV